MVGEMKGISTTDQIGGEHVVCVDLQFLVDFILIVYPTIALVLFPTLPVFKALWFLTRRESEDTALLILKEIYQTLGVSLEQAPH